MDINNISVYLKVYLRVKAKNTVRKKVALVGDGQINRICFMLNFWMQQSPCLLYSVALF